ncbi:hypothetical protein [Schlesneria paludicola]|uniref:hypothetical protein n=1 Tax=Schlesneria paludicola TaxID=360056 RepID=UPI00029AB889|nr:hypothetical protein [Schlesneria paludicola]
MTAIFPFGFSYPTAFYLTLYVLTFVLHQAFMHYVLAGCLYVTWSTIFPGLIVRPRAAQPLAATLRDWMPFMLSAAITAGVAPLLFIQIVYQSHFYTANLLLWWRWMIVIPVLITAFYLLYLIKSAWLWNRVYSLRVAVVVATSLCFVFVGFCWTANHLIACHGERWAEIYATGHLPLTASIVIPRMLVWIGGSFATMAASVGWQIWRQEERIDQNPDREPESYGEFPSSVRTLVRLAGGGMSVALVAGIVTLIQCDDAARSLIFGALGLPYLLLVILGVITQALGWAQQWRARQFCSFGMWAVSIGCLASLLGVSVIREGLRLGAIDITSLAPRHAEASTVGGFGVFLVATVIVVAAIAWCIRTVQRGMVR